MRRESSQLEYKEQITPTYLKTVSAFANYEGGQILFGITDSGEVIGLDSPVKDALSIENAINDSIDPVPVYDININHNTGVITLSIKPGTTPPYRYKGKAYCRHDSATVEVDRTELNRLVLRGSGQTFESAPATHQDLSFSVLESELVNHLNITSLSSDVMRSLGLMSSDGVYNRAAELLSDNNGYYGIDIARFGATEDTISERITLDKTSLLTQYSSALEVYKRYYQQDKIEEVKRETQELVPRIAFREALVNGIVHRTWDTNARLQIAMHTDNIVITSPGGLPYGITEEEYLHKEISLLRNPLIADVFFRLNYIERFGTGIQRIIRAYATANATPSFSVSPNTISIVLPVVTSSGNSDEEKILQAIKNGGELSHSDIVLTTGINKSKVSRMLSSLVSRNALVRMGNGRGTKYRLP